MRIQDHTSEEFKINGRKVENREEQEVYLSLPLHKLVQFSVERIVRPYVRLKKEQFQEKSAISVSNLWR